jgi:5-methylcytosine-specific restriction endonuclease McrA
MARTPKQLVRRRALYRAKMDALGKTPRQFFSPGEAKERARVRCREFCRAKRRRLIAEGWVSKSRSDKLPDAEFKRRRLEDLRRRRATPEGRETMRQYAHAAYHDNIEMSRMQGLLNANKRRAKLAQSPGNFTAADVARRCVEQKGLCALCGIPLTADFHVDHIIPISRGGSNDASNIQIAHPFCNRSKGARLPSPQVALASAA